MVQLHFYRQTTSGNVCRSLKWMGWRIPNITGISGSTVTWRFSCLTFGFYCLCNSRYIEALWCSFPPGSDKVKKAFPLWITYSFLPLSLPVFLSHSIRMALILSPPIQCSSLFIFYSWRLLYNSRPSEPTAIHTTLTNKLMESDWIFNKKEKWWQKQTRLHKWVTALATDFASTTVLLLVIMIYIMLA